MLENMYYIDECSICESGSLGLWACGMCQNIVILCDECDAMWPNAKVKELPIYAEEDNLPCPACSATLFENQSHWATQEEISRSQWIANALAEDLCTLTPGVAFSTSDECLDEKDEISQLMNENPKPPTETDSTNSTNGKKPI